MSDVELGIIAGLCFLLGAFFSGSETAFIASSRIRLRNMAERGNKRASSALELLDDPHYLMSAVLVGTNLAVIGCTSTFTAIMGRYFGDVGPTVATAVLVPLFLVFDELLPKGIFLYYGSKAAVLSVAPLKLFTTLLYPLVKVLSALTGLFTVIVGIRGKSGSSVTTVDLLYHLRESEEAGLIPAETGRMALRTVEIKKLKAADVMHPIDEVAMVEYGRPLSAYREAFSRHGFSRMPVYREERNRVVGILSVHNLFKADPERDGGVRLDPPYFVTPSTPLVSVLYWMRSQGCHMALVKEGERVLGMFTLEDIIERLVGEIEDEFH